MLGKKSSRREVQVQWRTRAWSCMRRVNEAHRWLIDGAQREAGGAGMLSVYLSSIKSTQQGTGPELGLKGYSGGHQL